MAFQYTALSDDFFEIRLLKIVPAENQNDPICVTVEHVPLESEPKYLALSYTWGRPSPHFPVEWDDPKATACITVNGMPFQVRHNLHGALHMLRSKGPRNAAWWIDAICINQDDIQERNRQVSGMRGIYEKCKGTAVWLGPADTTTHAAFHKIKLLAQSWEQRNDRLKVGHVADTDIEEYTELLRTEVGTSLQPWEALRHFFQRFWWERSWVVQEVFLPPTIVFQCGEYVVRWQDILNVGSVIMQHASSFRKVKDFEQATTVGSMVARLDKSFRAAGELMFLSIGRKQNDLAMLLHWFRRTRATDPRDKIYAALGICRNDETIRPDYSLCTNDVYMQAAKHSIETTRSFRILAHCRFPPTLDGLPSWVPDWSDREAVIRTGIPKKGHSTLTSEFEVNIYSASGQSRAEFRFEDYDRQLIVNGTILHELAFVSTGRDYEGPRNLSRLCGDDAEIHERYESDTEKDDAFHDMVRGCKWLREWAAFQSSLKHEFPVVGHGDWTYQAEGPSDQFDKPTYVLTRESLSVAYLRTLFMDILKTPGADHEHRISAEMLEGSWEVESRTLRADWYMRRGRAFAVSESGLFLLVPGEAQVGDSIAFVQGSEVPFILRPWGAGYLFIGECYVHGLMDGLAWELIEKHRWITELRIL